MIWSETDKVCDRIHPLRIQTDDPIFPDFIQVFN